MSERCASQQILTDRVRLGSKPEVLFNDRVSAFFRLGPYLSATAMSAAHFRPDLDGSLGSIKRLSEWEHKVPIGMNEYGLDAYMQD